MKAASIISGNPVTGNTAAQIRSYDGNVVGDVTVADSAMVDAAVRATADSLRTPFPAAERAAVLRRLARRIASEQEEYARLLVDECAKPYRESRAEVARAISVLEECAEEATRIQGHLVPVSGLAGSEDRFAFTLRVPVGVVAAITPYNGSLLSPAHKVGAAIAAGCACVLKPADKTPFGAYRFVQDLLEAGLPADRVALLVADGPEIPTALVSHPDVNMVSFTGSTRVGLQIREALGLRPAILELGGNAPLIVHEDANVAAAAAAAVPGAFGYAGQVCISVQRIYVHASRYQEFEEGFLAGVAALRVGDPRDESTDIGPLIDEQRAKAVETMAEDAVAAGARLLTPLRRDGALLSPIVLAGAPTQSAVVCEEAFGPVVSLFSYSDVNDAFAAANASGYGLQAGVYTRDFNVMQQAMHALRFGGVIFNDTSRYRVDRMPYGGTKLSGSGKEGVRYSIEQMTEERLVVLRPAVEAP
jgi:acyl-CoA reductase-like NAD-dependent aldehyde dehydrogenase